MKKYLIFTGVGDISDEYLSWANYKSKIYDRAVNYYDTQNYQKVLNLNCEYTFKNKGMIWNNFVLNYHLFKDYDYVLIVDSDLIINPQSIEETFFVCDKKKWTNCAWAHAEGSWGINLDMFKQKKKSKWRKFNYLEMHFMMLRKDLCKLAVEFWKKHELKFSTGVDYVISYLAHKHDMLPFYIYDKYCFFNPTSKSKRKISDFFNYSYDDRVFQLDCILENLVDSPVKKLSDPNWTNYIKEL